MRGWVDERNVRWHIRGPTGVDGRGVQDLPTSIGVTHD